YGAGIMERIPTDIHTGYVGVVQGPGMTPLVWGRDEALQAKRRGEPIEELSRVFGIPQTDQEGGSLEQVRLAKRNTYDIFHLVWYDLSLPEDVRRLLTVKSLRTELRKLHPVLNWENLNHRVFNNLLVDLSHPTVRETIKKSWENAQLMQS